MTALPLFVIVPPARGWDWLTQSHAMFSRARMYWLLLILGYYILWLVTTIVPVAGIFAAMLLKPVFAVGFLAAAWAQERGERPRLQRLFAGFRSNLRALLPLGVFHALGMSAALVMSATMDGGTLMRWSLLGEAPPGGNPWQAPGMQWAALVALFCSAPTIFALWFAPALVVFQDQSASTALVQSFRASIANIRAAIVYGMSVILFWIVIPGLIISISVLLFGEPGVYLGVALSTPFTLSVIAIIFIADYVVYRDLFHHHEGLAARAEKPGI